MGQLSTRIAPEQASAIRSRLHPDGAARSHLDERLLRFIEAEGDVLPAADSALSQLGRQLYRNEVRLDRCIDIISTDAALAHLVLRAANRAALGSRTFTIPYAVMFLGLVRLRLLFGVEVLRRMSAGAHGLSGDWMPFWKRNLFVARLLERLAAYYYPVDGTEYLAGLLHDASWPTVASFLKKECAVFFDRPETLFPLEKAFFGTSHAAIAAAMCIRSGLPPHVVEAVALHHGKALPENKGTATLRYDGPFLALLLRITDDVADSLGFPSSSEVNLESRSRGEEKIDTVVASREIAHLATFGRLPNIRLLAQEELAQVGQLGELFRD